MSISNKRLAKMYSQFNPTGSGVSRAIENCSLQISTLDLNILERELGVNKRTCRIIRSILTRGVGPTIKAYTYVKKKRAFKLLEKRLPATTPEGLVDDFLNDLDASRLRESCFEGGRHTSEVMPGAPVFAGNKEGDWVPRWMNEDRDE